MSLLPIEDALERIFARIPLPTAEIVPIAAAAGRVLAQPLLASHNQPPFDASAMDGYAVRAADVVPGHPLRLVGTAQAGQHFAGLMAEGQCVRIFTGAPLPIGADTVIMQEQAQADGNLVSFENTPRLGHSVRPAGNDFRKGQTLLQPGRVLTPAMVALAASANVADLTVAVRPRIAILGTGDELVPPGTNLGPDQIVGSNNYGLVPLLSPFAESVADLGIVRDDRLEIATTLQAAFDDDIDILITSGGASVGDHDYVQEVLKDLGVELDFWRINMRPGKPLMFGIHGKTLVFGLPGNPVSALVTTTVLILPALRQWLGMSDPLGPRMVLALAAPTPPSTARRHFMRGKYVRLASGLTGVEPIGETDSGHLSSVSEADVLIIQPENDPGQPAGTPVELIPLR